MIIGTTYVDRQEYALALVECDMVTPDYKSRHRYQTIYVIRNDRLAEYRQDLGPVQAGIPPFRILGAAVDGTRVYFEHTIAELQDMADALREDTKRFKERLAYLQETSTLIQDAIDQAEENHLILHNTSRFGPGGSTQRNGFSLKGAQDYVRRNRQQY